MNELKLFDNPTFGEVRIIMRGDHPWFVAMDVAKILEYSDTQAMTRRLKESELSTYTDNSSGQGRSLVIISEPGLYRAIFGSKKPEAEVFQDWVFTEVLPAIRKTGQYKGTRTYQRESLSAMYASLQKLKDKTSDSAKELLSWVAGATDYTPSSKESNLAFAKIQNIVHMVATGKSAGEIRMERAEAGQIHCGLRSGVKYNTRGDLDKKASEVARNFLDDNELSMEDAFFQMVVGRLNFDIMRDGVKYTIDEFTDFCYECAEVLRGQIEVQRMKTKYHKSKKSVNNYTHRQVGKYNADLALRDEGREVHLLEQKKLLLASGG